VKVTDHVVDDSTITENRHSATRSTDLTFGILGTTTLRVGDDFDERWGASRLRAMLATQLVHSGRVVSIDTLVDWVWPDEASHPQSPAATFHTYAARIRATLRQLPKPSTLRTVNGGYQLDVEKSAIDYSRFRALMTDARTHTRTNRHEQAADCAERALRLWRGRGLDDLRSEPAGAWRTRVLRDELLPAGVILIEALLRLRRFEEAMARLDDLKTIEEDDLTLAKLQLSVLHGQSRYTDATAYYIRKRRQLLDDADELAAKDLRDHHEYLREASVESVAHPATPPTSIAYGKCPHCREVITIAALLSTPESERLVVV
jgi:DNA-binding SARP family transcriptional activator